MSKGLDQKWSGSKLTRRKFLETSLKVGVGAAGMVTAGIGCVPQAVTPPATSQPVAPTTPSVKPAVVEFWQIGQGEGFHNVMAEAIQEFENTHPNVKVSLTEQPAGDLRAKVFPILTDGGPGPDVIYDGSVMSFTYAGMPFGFMDISDRVEATGIKEATPASAWATMQKEGEIFGLPWGAFPFYLVYNKDLYEEVGIADLPQTWEDLTAVVDKLHDPSKDRFGFLNTGGRWASWLLETLWYDSEVGYFEGSEDFLQYDVTKPITITRPEAVAALEYMRSLCETAPGGLQGNIGVGTGDVVARFAQGNIGHIFVHAILVNIIQEQNPEMVPKKNFDVMVFPNGPKRGGVMFSTSVLGVTKLSKNPDAAWEFVKFISDWEGRIAPAGGLAPVRTDVEVNEDLPGSWLVPAGREALSGSAFPQAYFPEYDSLRLPLGDNIEAYFLDQKTAEEALKDTAAQAKAALAG